MDERTRLSLIAQIYDAALDPANWPKFLDALGETFGGAAWLFSQDLANAEASLVFTAHMDAKFVKSYEDYYSRTNIWFQSSSHLIKEGFYAAGQDTVAPATLERSEFYNDWLRPQGLYESAGGCLVMSKSLMTSFTIIRGGPPGTLRPAEVTLLKSLMPHLRRAIDVHGELFSARLKSRAGFDALDRLAVGILVTAADGRLLSCNRSGEAVLQAGRGLGMQHGRVRGETAAATQQLHRTIAEAARTGAGEGSEAGGTLLLPRGPGARLSVLIAPLRPEREFVGGGSEPAAMLLVSDPQGRPVSRSELAGLYGLSQAEARLLEALVGGTRLGDYAARTGVSLSTVRTQLAQVFLKTGENRQSDLIRRVLRDLTLM